MTKNKELTLNQIVDLSIKGKGLVVQELILEELVKLNDFLNKRPAAKSYKEEVEKRISARMKENQEKAKAKRKPRP